jgi:hypothetical protein
LLAGVGLLLGNSDYTGDAECGEFFNNYAEQVVGFVRGSSLLRRFGWFSFYVLVSELAC